MVIIEQFTLRGIHFLNEDALIINERAALYGVLDGVSSIVPYLSDKKETGGFIAAQAVKNYFESLERAEQLIEHAAEANQKLRELMLKANIDMEKKDGLWGTAMALVRLHEDRLEFIQTGDCMIIAVYQDGAVRPLTWRQVAHLESSAIAKWEEGVSQGLSSQKDLHETVIDTIRENRFKSNTDEGYGVLNGEPQAVRFLEYGNINKSRLKHVILLTDGLFWPPKDIPVDQSYWEYTAQRILEKGLEQYAHDLLGIEEADPECLTHARFKKSDDKTGMVVHLNNDDD
ncbi:protein phosphatase 2C domain-containing protein [Paenibacillus solani]|uniref:protein phosphatase 2C domain-containing protein n=1 Tax=Paenibacillus solani TaxID=1705565 RepID=UPI003D28F536